MAKARSGELTLYASCWLLTWMKGSPETPPYTPLESRYLSEDFDTPPENWG